MLFELFLTLLAFSIIWFLIGFHFENYPSFLVSGIGFLLLAIATLTTGVTIETGFIETQVMPCGNYINESCEQGTTYNITTVRANTYTSSEGIANNTIGIFMLFLAFFAFACVSIYAAPKKDRGYGREPK